VGRSLGKCLLGSLRIRWEDHIKIDVLGKWAMIMGARWDWLRFMSSVLVVFSFLGLLSRVLVNQNIEFFISV
jgi:hypothetical protein